MKIESHQDVDVLAVSTHERVTTLLELTAPELPATDGPRPPAALVVVLDRSGSMGGARLEGAKTALHALVDRLDPTDQFGVVVFDDTAQVAIPAGPLHDKASAHRAIAAIHPGGCTDLSAGYLRGLQEVRRVAAAGGAPGAKHVLLISDGHANAGVTDPDQLATVAANAARADDVTTIALGFGLGYDETLIAAIARGGRGAELFAEEADTAIALIAREVDGLLGQSVQAASLLVRMSPEVSALTVVNDLPSHAVSDAIMVELGGFVAGETRRVLLSLDVPGIARQGRTDLATIEARWVRLPDLVEESTTVTVSAQVVAAERAAGRTPDPLVTTELGYQQAQRAKREASRLLQSGDVAGAQSRLAGAVGDLDGFMAGAPLPMRAELADEAALLDALLVEATAGDASRASKAMSADAALKSRRRGRSS